MEVVGPAQPLHGELEQETIFKLQGALPGALQSLTQKGWKMHGRACAESAVLPNGINPPEKRCTEAKGALKVLPSRGGLANAVQTFASAGCIRGPCYQDLKTCLSARRAPTVLLRGLCRLDLPFVLGNPRKVPCPFLSRSVTWGRRAQRALEHFR